MPGRGRAPRRRIRSGSRSRCAVTSASPARRAALITMAEIAFLVSGPSGASSLVKTCRHEQPGRPPRSQAAIAYQKQGAAFGHTKAGCVLRRTLPLSWWRS